MSYYFKCLVTKIQEEGISHQRSLISLCLLKRLKWSQDAENVNVRGDNIFIHYNIRGDTFIAGSNQLNDFWQVLGISYDNLLPVLVQRKRRRERNIKYYYNMKKREKVRHQRKRKEKHYSTKTGTLSCYSTKS